MVNFLKFLRFIFGSVLGINKTFFYRKYFQLKFPNSRIASTVIFLKNKGTHLNLENNSSIGHYSVIAIENDPLGIPGIKSAFTLGQDSYVGEHNNIRASGGTIEIGKNCLISQNTSLIASNHSVFLNQNIRQQAWDIRKTGIKIQDDVWIGCGSVILPGVTISKGAVIGSNSVVVKDVPENAIVAGNPARIIKYRK